jgi:hypothetical protein
MKLVCSECEHIEYCREECESRQIQYVIEEINDGIHKEYCKVCGKEMEIKANCMCGICPVYLCEDDGYTVEYNGHDYEIFRGSQHEYWKEKFKNKIDDELTKEILESIKTKYGE